MLWLGTQRGGARFELDDSLVTKTMAILAKKGAGKSYTAGVVMEEFAKNAIPFVMLDPVGIHHGIRSSADGSAPGFPIVVFGGDHADIPIDGTHGDAVARTIVSTGASAVVDVSQLSKGDWRRFVRDFCRTLYQINRTPRHVFIEEAAEFVPQRLRPDLMETFEAVERLVRLGRNRGLGATLISQRSAQVAKDVLTQIDILIVLQTVGKPDRDAVLGTFASQLDEAQLPLLREFEATIAGMPQGEVWVWAPALNMFERVKIRERETFHGGATPVLGVDRQEMLTVDAVVDILELRAAFEALAAPTEKQEAPREKGSASADVEALRADMREQLVERDRVVAKLQQDLAETREALMAAEALADSVGSDLEVAQGDLIAAQNRLAGADLIRQGFRLLLGVDLARPDGDHVVGLVQTTDPPAIVQVLPKPEDIRAAVEQYLREHPELVARSGPPLPPPAVILAEYKKRAIDRLITKLDMGGLETDAYEAMRFLLTQSTYTTANRVSVIMGSGEGAGRERWVKALGELTTRGLVKKGGSGNSAYKVEIREMIQRELSAHDPTEQDVEDVYNEILRRLV